jgi:hypothetical protein
MGQIFSDLIVYVFQKQSEDIVSQPSTSWLIIFCPKPVTTTLPGSSAADDDGSVPKQRVGIGLLFHYLIWL